MVTALVTIIMFLVMISLHEFGHFITAKLIDECGLKGYQIGGAQISEKHAGFIINKENATAEDVIKLMEYTKEQVYNKFGKTIEPEIEIIK